MSDHAMPVDVEAPAPEATARGLWPAVVRLFPALGVPGFRLLWFASFPATIAWQLSAVATGYAALTISGSATLLGVVTGLSGLPMLLFAPIGGVVADRFPRRTVLFCSQGTLLGSALILALLSLAGWLEVWHLGVLGLFQGTAFAFNMPARHSLVMDTVGQRLARSAAALNTSPPNTSRVVGPSIAGILLSTPWIGITGVFFTMVLMYTIVILTLLRVPPSPSRVREGGLRAAWDSLIEGFRYILGSPIHRGLLGTAFVLLVLGSPVLQIMPVFSERVYEVGATGLGLLLSANGIGALMGTFGTAVLAGHRRAGQVQLGFGLGIGLTVVGFALAPSMSAALVMVWLFGMFQAGYMALNGTILMGNTDPRLYGRVLSIYLMTFAITPVAALPLAWASDHVDPRLAVGVSGAMTVIAVVVLAYLSPAARRAR